MLKILLLVSPFLSGNCLNIPVLEVSTEDPDLACIANITNQYFKPGKSMVYVNQRKSEDDLLLKNLHTLHIISFNRRGVTDIVKPNMAYMVVATSVPEFLEQNLTELFLETNWNPYARFLIIIKSLQAEELLQVFDVLLAYRIYNVTVLNSTSTAELYTYNPFENFACGRYYTRIIYHGKCSDVTAHIYPNKAITGLKNCFFNVSVPHWPPWGIDPAERNNDPNVIGTEQYIFHLMSEIEQFKYKFRFDYDPEAFSTVSQNLTISGPMIRLAQNYTDIMLGGLMLIPSRGNYFGYVSGHLDCIDEIRLIVQKAGHTPAWRDIYFEFSATVWILLTLSLIVYSALVYILLQTKDKGYVVLVLLSHLLSHGFRFRCRQSVKQVVIIWVISAFLINNFYTTTLMSLTTKPSYSYQISNEQELIEHSLEPCVSVVMGDYLNSEPYHGDILKEFEVGTSGCEKLIESVKTVSETNRMFTIVLYSVFYIDRRQFYDEFGASSVYSFRKPYAKVIYAIYFNKGFPMKDKLHSLALRIREVGLSEKSLRDQQYNETLKYHFHAIGYKARFAIPWYLYAGGLIASTITFVVELASQYNKAPVTIVDK